MNSYGSLQNVIFEYTPSSSIRSPTLYDDDNILTLSISINNEMIKFQNKKHMKSNFLFTDCDISYSASENNSIAKSKYISILIVENCEIRLHPR